MNEKELQERAQIQQQILQMENITKQNLTKEAIERYGNLKSAHQEKALQVIALISQLSSQNQIKEKITDEQFKDLLLRLDEPKKETKISWR